MTKPSLFQIYNTSTNIHSLRGKGVMLSPFWMINVPTNVHQISHVDVALYIQAFYTIYAQWIAQSLFYILTQR